MKTRGRGLSAAGPEAGRRTPRVAVVPLAPGPLDDRTRERLDAALDAGVCGVVLDVPDGAFVLGHARAARQAADLLATGGLTAVLVVDADRDATLLELEGYTGPTAPTLVAALVAVSGSAAQDEAVRPVRPPQPRSPMPRRVPTTAASAPADTALDDEVLRGLAELGLRFRTGAVLAARAAGVTLVEFLVISELALRGHVTQGDLGHVLALPGDEVDAVLRQLADLGLVLRFDERPAGATLTPLGRELLFTPAGELAHDLRTAVEGLGAPTRTALTTVLGTWSAAQERHNGRLREWIDSGSA